MKQIGKRSLFSVLFAVLVLTIFRLYAPRSAFLMGFKSLARTQAILERMEAAQALGLISIP